MHDLTVSDIVRQNPANGGKIRKRHALEMIRQGKARKAGTYFPNMDTERTRIVMDGTLYTFDS